MVPRIEKLIYSWQKEKMGKTGQCKKFLPFVRSLNSGSNPGGEEICSTSQREGSLTMEEKEETLKQIFIIC